MLGWPVSSALLPRRQSGPDSDPMWGANGQRPRHPVTRVTITWHIVTKLTKLWPLSKISNILKFFREKNWDNGICPAAGSECSVRRTSGTLLFYWHKDCFMWGQSDGPDILPYFGTKTSRLNVLSCFFVYCSFKAGTHKISISSFQESVANFSLSHL